MWYQNENKPREREIDCKNPKNTSIKKRKKYNVIKTSVYGLEARA